MNAAALRAQAKINLRLRILAREANGYHQIETLFCRLALADEIRVELTRGSESVVCHGPAIPEAGLGNLADNIAIRAARAYLAAAGDTRGVRIEIQKLIPVGGGLGGGSADAGAVLRILQQLVGALSPTSLMELAASLGADVPFLTQELSPLAWGWGRGDRLLTLPALPSVPCSLVVAPFGVNTGEAYSWLGFQQPNPRAALVAPAAPTSWPEAFDLAANDFEGVVLARHPSLGEAFRALRLSRGEHSLVQMSGSGATLFALGGQLPSSGSAAASYPPGFRIVETSTASGVDPVRAG